MQFTRRHFIKTTGAAGLTLAAAPAFSIGAPSSGIDRRALVQRHNPDIAKLDPFSALSVGNGEFAFTTDVTGLQTFSAECEKDFPLCTMSHWGWHSFPAPDGIRREDYRFKDFDVYGRKSAMRQVRPDRKRCSTGCAKIRTACTWAALRLNSKSPTVRRQRRTT
jgi:hypothetical protein